MKAGDVLEEVNGAPRVASEADIAYALHHAPACGAVAVSWSREVAKTSTPTAIMNGVLTLPEGWRRNDISWRGSMWTMPPNPGVYGDDLSAEEKRKLGLGEKRLAFRQGDYVPKPARDAGIRARDVILGIDDKPLEMNMLQFNVYVRTNYNVGDRVTFNIVREGQHLDLPAVLRARD